MRHTCARVLALAAFAGLLASSAGTGLIAAGHIEDGGRERGGSVDARDPKPTAKYKGLAAADWLAIWWQTVFATAVEAGHHQLIDGDAVEANKDRKSVV